MYPTILDTQTGQKLTLQDWDLSTFWWMEGNGSCDCNRAIAMGVAEELDRLQRLAHPELKDHQSLCHGCKRFIAVDVHGDLEGLDKREVIAAMNSDYPTALAALIAQS